MHIVLFSKEFENKVQERVRRFIWNGKHGCVRKEDIILPKQQGDLDLLPLQEQTPSIFGNLVARIFHLLLRPARASLAHTLLAFYLRKTGYDVSNLYERLSRDSQVIAKSKEILTF
jgi:hypothetical protein